MKREVIDNVVHYDCSKCGKMFPAYTVGDITADTLESWYSVDEVRLCDNCRAAAEADEIRKEEDLKRRAFLADVPRIAIEDAGIPEFYLYSRENGELLISPIVPAAARKIWEHRTKNLLISGETGAGKSTSACFVALKMLERHKAIRYVKLRKFLAEWKNARTSKDDYAEDRFFNDIRKLDVLIIDEIADKVKYSESGQELMYEILDMLYCGEINNSVWMLGNFREGVLADVFGDTDPVFRRIRERFVCLLIADGTAAEFKI